MNSRSTELGRALDNSLKILCRKFGRMDRLLEYDDMLQECRIAAFRSQERWRTDGGSSRERWAYHCAYQWLLSLRRIAWNRRRLAPMASYDGWQEHTQARYLSRRDFAPMLVEMLSEPEPPTERPVLSASELPVLLLLCEGKDAAESAAALCLSTRTVHFHLGSICRKWGVSKAIEAYRVAMEEGLVEPPSRRRNQ